MKNQFKTFSSGYGVSLIGALPLGVLNVTAFKIAITKGLYDALLFTIAVVSIEIVVVRICLFAAGRIRINSKLSYYLYPIAIALLVYLAIDILTSIQEITTIKTDGIFFPEIKSSFLLGLLLSALNPLQFPYWIGWNKIMLERKVLKVTTVSFSSYLIGIGLGTLTALLLFIFIGHYIFKDFEEYNYIVSLILGLIYICFAIYLMILFYKKHLKSMKNHV